MSIFRSTIPLSIVIIVVAISATATLWVRSLYDSSLKEAYRDQAAQIKVFRELLAQKGPFRKADGILYAGNTPLNGHHEVPETLARIYGGSATIFLGDVRIATTVRKPDGTVADGTRLVGPARDALFVRGETYHGDSPILGIIHLATYEPIRDAGGAVIGALYVGIPQNEFLARYRKDALRTVLVSGGLVLVFSVLGWALMRESRRMQNRLVESEERYRTVFETTGCATVIVEADTTISFANAEFLSMVGLPRERVERCVSFRDFVRDPDRERMKQYHLMRRGLADGVAPASYEFRLYGCDGQPRDVVCSVGMIGGTDRSVLSFLDVTTQKAAERELRLTQFSVETAGAAIYRVNAEGRFIFSNDAATRMLGYTREEFLEMTVLDIDPGVGAKDWPVIWEECSRIGAVTFERVHRTKDGRDIPVEVLSTNRAYEGEQYGFCFVRDITERRQIENSLRESEELFRHVFEHSALGIGVADASGRLIVCNSALAEIVGYEIEELRGSTFELVTPAEDVEAELGAMQDFFSSGRSSAIYDKRYLRKDGGIRWGRLTISSIASPEGGVSRLIAIVEDTTSARLAEQELRQKSEQIRLIADSAPSLIAYIDSDLNYRFVNRRYEQWYGLDSSQIVGRTAADLQTPEVFARLAPYRLRVLEGMPVSFTMDFRNRFGELRHLDLDYVPDLDSEGTVQGYVLQGHDITDLKRAEGMLAAEREVLALIADGATIQETLSALCLSIERLSRDAACSILLVTDSGTLSFCVGPSLPASYNAALGSVPIGPAIGSCGTAAYLRQQVIVADIATDPLWEGFRKLPLRHGLHACWSTPILSGDGTTHGTFAMYYREPRTPEEFELRLVNHAVEVARIAIERHRAAAALAETRQRQQAILDNVPDLLWLKDTEGRYLTVNAAFAAGIGMTLESITGKTDYDLWPPDLAALYRENDLHVQAAGERKVLEEQVETLDGRRVWMESVKTPLRDSSGVIIGTSGVARDIDHRKRAEEAIRKSEEKFSAAFHTCPDSVSLSRLEDGVLLEVNHGFTTVFGYTAAEAVGTTPYELGLWVRPEERSALVAPLTATGGITGLEVLFRKKDGRHVTCLMSANTFEIDGVRYFIAIVRDISDRIRAEQALRESEERFRQIFRQNEDGIILFRRSTFEIIDANPVAEEIFGYSVAALAEMGHWPLLQPKEARKFVQGVAKLDEEQSFRIDRIGCVRKDGTRFVVSIWGKAITLDNDEVVYCSIRDITEKIVIEEQMQETQAKLIQTNKMTSLGMLVSGIAHEINNPNNFIGINSAILADVWRDARPALARAHEEEELRLAGLPFPEMEKMIPRLLDGLAKGSERIAAIIRNLRDFSREGGSMVAAAVDIRKVIDDALLILTHQIHKHTDNLVVDVPEQLPSVKGNAQQIEQVIINLIMNSLQALPSRRAGLTVRAGHDGEGDAVVVVVRDEGAGMAREVLERVTEPFFSTRLAEGGTGLGLSISAAIVKEHAGTLRFESEEGIGTTATVTLPVAQDRP